MSKDSFYTPFTWQSYSRNLRERILDCCHAGELTERKGEIRLVKGVEKGAICLYLHVDENDGVIVDARFQAFGPSVLIGFAETICELIMRKTYDQAMRMSADYVEKYLQDRKNIQPFPKETYGYINLVLSALEQALHQCDDIPIENPISTPLADYHEMDGEESHPDFPSYTDNEKKTALEKVIQSDIRPYIELDAGNVEVIKVNGSEVVIRYQGACVSCYAATGSTLESIQAILQRKVHPSIVVTPSIQSAGTEIDHE